MENHKRETTRLEDLVPIAVVIAAGCEPCAERMVARALAAGASRGDVRKIIGIAWHMAGEACLADAVGPDVLERMKKPVKRAREALKNHGVNAQPSLPTGDPESLVDKVRERYGQIARSEQQGCCSRPASTSCCGPKKSTTLGLGYNEADLDSVPKGSNLGLGCGAPIALLDLEPGETVLDLGSGGGFDALIAAQKVGEGGKVIGVDMTPDMLALARKNAAEAGASQVEFREGRLESLPVDDGSVDAVTSNCVINLVPDKGQVFGEIARVLKPGGRLVISDVILDGELPASVAEDLEAYVGCVSGAMGRDRYFDILDRNGLGDVEVLSDVDFLDIFGDDPPPEVQELANKSGITIEDVKGLVKSVTFRARKAAR